MKRRDFLKLTGCTILSSALPVFKNKSNVVHKTEHDEDDIDRLMDAVNMTCDRKNVVIYVSPQLYQKILQKSCYDRSLIEQKPSIFGSCSSIFFQGVLIFPTFSLPLEDDSNFVIYHLKEGEMFLYERLGMPVADKDSWWRLIHTPIPASMAYPEPVRA